MAVIYDLLLGQHAKMELALFINKRIVTWHLCCDMLCPYADLYILFGVLCLGLRNLGIYYYMTVTLTWSSQVCDEHIMEKLYYKL